MYIITIFNSIFKKKYKYSIRWILKRKKLRKKLKKGQKRYIYTIKKEVSDAIDKIVEKVEKDREEKE